jgi:NAD(P)-dependent dehydrogenase (short-subunit alcohol dehydrogenase family)
MARHSMARHTMARHSMARHRLIRHRLLWHRLLWHRLLWHRLLWHSGLGLTIVVIHLTAPATGGWDLAGPLLFGYNSSKAALNAITLIYAGTLRGTGIRVNALSPGFCATDLNNHTGRLSADEGGAHIARQITLPGDGPTGVFLSEDGGTCPW